MIANPAKAGKEYLKVTKDGDEKRTAQSARQGGISSPSLFSQFPLLYLKA